MNIAIFTDTYYPDTNGVAVTTKTLVDVLRAKGNNVVVVTSMIDNKIPSNENYIYYLSFSSTKRTSLFVTMRDYNLKIFKKIKEFKPDIIHNHTNGQIAELGYYTASKLKVPVVYTYHIHSEDFINNSEGELKRNNVRRRKRFLKRVINQSTEFIVPSLKIKNYLRKKGFDKYINIVPAGIDPTKFEEDEIDAKEVKYLRKKFNIGEDEKIILFVGALSTSKRIDYLINSFKKFVDSNSNHKVHLLIVGEGNEMENLKQLANSLELSDKVSFYGKANHEKIKSLYHIADVYVTASTSETQSLCAMEAMAANCVVLLRDDETLVGFVEEGQNGFIFLDDDQFVSQLDKILSMSDKELTKIRKAAYKTIVDNYSLDEYYEKVLEVYDRGQRKLW